MADGPLRPWRLVLVQNGIRLAEFEAEGTEIEFAVSALIMTAKSMNGTYWIEIEENSDVQRHKASVQNHRRAGS